MKFETRSLAAQREVWRGICWQRLAKGPATSGDLAVACGAYGDDQFYAWLRTQKIFPRGEKVVGKSGQVNNTYTRPK